MRKSIKIKKKLFEFVSMEDWIENGYDRFQEAYAKEKIINVQTICIDQKGLVCSSGMQFGFAVYPIEVFMLVD